MRVVTHIYNAASGGCTKVGAGARAATGGEEGEEGEEGVIIDDEPLWTWSYGRIRGLGPVW